MTTTRPTPVPTTARKRRRSRRNLLTRAILAVGVTSALLLGFTPSLASAAEPDPSGVPMPGQSKPGWYLRFADDFTGTSLNTKDWYEYSGHPSGVSGSVYAPSHDIVKNGMLILESSKDSAGEWESGGVSSSKALSQTYGLYEVRFRMDPGIGVTYDNLLWPSDNSWPPELDFAEDNSQNRSTVNAFQHFEDPNTNAPGQFVDQTKVNMQQWHTLGIEWSPDQIIYTLDGAPWAVETNVYVPNIPMVLDIQTEDHPCDGANAGQCITSATPSEVNMDIDWVVEYGKIMPS